MPKVKETHTCNLNLTMTPATKQALDQVCRQRNSSKLAFLRDAIWQAHAELTQPQTKQTTIRLYKSNASFWYYRDFWPYGPPHGKDYTPELCIMLERTRAIEYDGLPPFLQDAFTAARTGDDQWDTASITQDGQEHFYKRHIIEQWLTQLIQAQTL